MDVILNVFAALSLSGAFSGALHGGRATEIADGQRRRRWLASSQKWRRHFDIRWHEKVEELANRGFTLDALLAMYKGLGKDYMQHFNGAQSTTTDVVRGAIIPLSREQRCAHSEVMMRGACVRPLVMVTHNWGNLFRDLVSAIIADALEDVEYDMIAHLLDHSFDTLETMVRIARVGSRSYWVCAFCVNQHAGICAGNPYHSTDAVSGAEHAVCNCGLEKAWNDTEPVDQLHGRSIPCEMNKFDDMVELLSVANPRLAQIIAVDGSFAIFSRAWCVAEIATSHRMGMQQTLKIKTFSLLDEHEEALRQLRIEDMEATRPEDKIEILGKVPDHSEFNAQMQTILFGELLPAWKHMDVATQLDRVGRVIRSHSAMQIIGAQNVKEQISCTRIGLERDPCDSIREQVFRMPSGTELMSSGTKFSL